MTESMEYLELKNLYGIELTTEDKLNALKSIEIDLDEHLAKNSSRHYRIPLLVKKITINECQEILKSYCAVNKILGELEDNK